MSMLYTATVEVLIPQIVWCSHCDEQFGYEMERTGIVQAECGTDSRSQARAKTIAEDAARRGLHEQFRRYGACDPVPFKVRVQPIGIHPDEPRDEE